MERYTNPDCKPEMEELMKDCPRSRSGAECWLRLCDIEDILGDEYDLGELREMVQAKREGRCVEDDTKPTFLVSCWEKEKGIKGIGNWATDEWLKIRFGEKLGGPAGKKGMPGLCPKCGEFEGLEWDEKTDVSRCKLCGWTDRKEADMDKPLKDWTLGELKEWCYYYRKSCTEKACEEDCDIHQRGICLKGWVHDWDLEETPRFTEQEVEDAKAIKRMFGDDNFTHIHKDEDGLCEMMDGPVDDPNVGWCAIGMEEGMFPSIRPGETVTLDEIIGGAE